MQHVVHVESSRNPFAIGVVGGYLARQPKNLEEALATVSQLKQEGYNFSVGISQVNRHNLAKYGIKTYEQAFEVCPNLQAGSRILRECYDRAQDWGKAFSCYYSGNFATGFQHGYVQKVFASIRRAQTSPPLASEAIRVIPYANNQRKVVERVDGVALHGATAKQQSATASAASPARVLGASYPEPSTVRRAVAMAGGVTKLPLETAEDRPAIPVHGPGAVMPTEVAQQRPSAIKDQPLDLSQIPTQVVGGGSDPYQTRVVMPAKTPAVSGAAGKDLPLPVVPEAATASRTSSAPLPTRFDPKRFEASRKSGAMLQNAQSNANDGRAASSSIPLPAGEGTTSKSAGSPGDHSFVF